MSARPLKLAHDDSRDAPQRAPQVLTPAQTARLLGRSRSTVEKWCADGVLPARRVGSRWWLTLADLKAGGWVT